MDDLISRQAAIDALGEEPPVWYDGEDEIAERNQWKRDIEAIKQLPPIQPDIVRCKGCEHGVLDDGFPHQYFCVFKGDEWNNADYFCGHAKKREVTT